MRFCSLSRMLLLVLFLLPGSVWAAQAPVQDGNSPADAKQLVVGVTQAPPFIIKEGDQYRGLGIDVWREIARTHGWQFRFQYYDLDGLLQAVETGKVDVGLGALTTTAEREAVMDFAHPITSSGLGVAVRNEGGSGWLAVAQAFLSPAFLKVIGTLALLLLIVGIVIWAVEHKGNPEEFGGSRAHGIFSGFWWAMVTMTTVGYGDTAPRSVPGRILGMVWMLTALLIVSFFTAAITSALTVGSLSSGIDSASDLHTVRVATVAASTSGHWLKEHNDPFQEAETLDDALASLAAGKVDAVIFDKPLLRWKIQQNHAGNLKVLPLTLERQDYAFALPAGSALREPIDAALLTRINSAGWSQLVKGYLGNNL